MEDYFLPNSNIILQFVFRFQKKSSRVCNLKYTHHSRFRFVLKKFKKKIVPLWYGVSREFGSYFVSIQTVSLELLQQQ